MGKHTSEALRIKELEESIKQKDKEMLELKLDMANVFNEIRTLNESNDYGDPSVKRRKISELCTDARYQLLIEVKNRTTTTNQSNK